MSGLWGTTPVLCLALPSDNDKALAGIVRVSALGMLGSSVTESELVFGYEGPTKSRGRMIH